MVAAMPRSGAAPADPALAAAAANPAIPPAPPAPSATPPQQIIKFRRDYNSWVASETMEDCALRFTPRTFRK